MAERRRRVRNVGNPESIVPRAGMMLGEQAEGIRLAEALLHIFYYCRYSGDDSEPCRILKPFIEKYFKQLEKRIRGESYGGEGGKEGAGESEEE